MKNDTLVGGWDSFSWLSPWEYSVDGDGQALLTPLAYSAEDTLAEKQFVELLELVAIRLGSPESNSQMPSNDKQIKWMTQVRSGTSLASLEEKIDQVLRALDKLSNQKRKR